nr:G5 domain-containing protein [Anaerotignum propionicum]
MVTGTYTVVSNDALYKIAQKYECSLEDLLKLNPGMTVQTGIHVGQVLNVPISKPKISVKTIETQVLTTVEPKTYEYQTDNTQPKSYQKVKQQGRAGQKKSTIQITRINGFVQEEKEISKEIITQPVPEIIVRGTL